MKPPRRAARAIEGRPARRLRRAADRRAYERICRQLRPAARLADRLPGLGRLGGGAAGGSGDLRRRPLHAAGPRPGRRQALELPVGARDQHRRLAQGPRARRRPDRLRSLAAHQGLGEQGARGAGRQGRRAGRGPQQPDRRGLGRPARAVAGAADRPSRRICRPVLGRQAPGNGRLAEGAEGRRGGARRARIRSPGRSTCAARTSTTRRSPCPSLWSTTTAPPTCSSRRRRSATTSASISATASASTSATISSPRSAASPARPSRSIPSARSRRSSRRWSKAGAKVVAKRDPSILPKAIKNEVEIAGHRAAQARDGAALSRFLHWLSVEAPKGGVDELDGGGQAAGLPPGKAATCAISASTPSPAPGPNGAIVHYRVSEETNRPLEMDSIYLVDSRRPISGRHHRRHPHGRRSARRRPR